MNPSSVASQEVRASIQPQIYATEITTKVAMKAAGKELFNTYQIANRFMMLSSSLEASGDTAESCAALSMSAWCAIESLVAVSSVNTDEVFEGDSTSEEILLFPDSAFLSVRSQDNDSTTIGLSPIIKRLARAYIHDRTLSKDEQSQNDDTLPQRGALPSSYTLEQTLTGKVMTVASSSATNNKVLTGKISLSKLLHCAVWNQKRFKEELSTAQIADIVREVLISTLKIAKSNDDGIYLHFIDELKLFLHAQTKRLGDIVDADLLQVISSSFHVIFSAQLVDPRLLNFPRQSAWALRKSVISAKRVEYKLLQASCTQLQQAEKKFVESSADEHSVQDVCFFAQWASVQLHRAILSEHLALSEVSESDRIRVKQVRSVTKKYLRAISTCR